MAQNINKTTGRNSVYTFDKGNMPTEFGPFIGEVNILMMQSLEEYTRHIIIGLLVLTRRYCDMNKVIIINSFM